MDLTALVGTQYQDSYYFVVYLVVPTIQTLMSVRMRRTTVMRMPTAQTQWGVSPAPATLVTLEMESTVQVSIKSNI